MNKITIYKIRAITPVVMSRAFTSLLALLFFSCSKFVDVGPPKTEIISASVFSDDASATSAVRGIFSMMMSDQSFTNGQLEKYTGLSSDELVDHTGSAQVQQFYNNNLVSANANVLGVFWTPAYKYISNANSVLEGISKSNGLTQETAKTLEGEAKFIRAFCHFYLVNLFGDVPYVTSTDYRVNAALSRNSVAEVYGMIVSDLLDAEQLLPADLAFANGQRIEPNKGAATALLARVYLYMSEWAKAQGSATAVIDNSLYSIVTDLDSVFLANSAETILQFSPVTPENSTPQARMFLLTVAPNYISLTDEFYSSFEPGDLRKDHWVGIYNDGTADFYYPFKYKVYSADMLTEYATVLRLGEQYLVRAEANARLNNLSASIADVDILRARAGLPLIADTDPGISQDNLLLAIEKERRAELFTEGGHRWLDLKRNGRAEEVLSPIKEFWTPNSVLYPIPQSEIKLDPNLTQNPGYDQ